MQRQREQRECKNDTAYVGDVDDTVEEEAEKESIEDEVKDGNEDDVMNDTTILLEVYEKNKDIVETNSL